MSPKGSYVGVDGCPKGWVSVALMDAGIACLQVFASLLELWRAHSDADIILIDMPIGLLERGPGERHCETEARRLISLRRSSVFPVPCRQAVYADSDLAAITANREHMKKGLSMQALAIRHKIREVDELLRSDATARRTFQEVHPELLFTAMNSGQPMSCRKKSRDGKDERLSLLSDILGKAIVNQVMAQSAAYRRRDLQEDDVLDALAAAVAASHHEELLSIPPTPIRDVHKLPMQMVYWPHTSAAYRDQ